MKAYSYKAYGLNINSEIELPELVPYDGKPDINIKIGKFKEKLDNPVKKGIRFEVADNEFMLRLDNIARFYANDGEEIIIEPCKNCDMDDVRLFLLGSVFGAVLHQREHFVLHASSIETPMGAICISGPSGAGKSTLTKSFSNKGYKVLCDDVTSITFDGEGNPFVSPGFDKIKLWEDSAKYLNEDIENATKIRKGIHKYNIKLGNSFSAAPTPLSAVFVLGTNSIEDIMFRKIESFHKIQALINNTYRINFLSGTESRETHLKQCGKISEKVKMYGLIRPRNTFVVDRMMEIIESEMASWQA